MSKIESYYEAKRLQEQIEDVLDKLRDKHWNIGVSDVKIGYSYKVYYGNSAASRWPEDVVKEVEKEVQRSVDYLLERALARAKVMTDKARKAAEEEAKEILGEIR